MSLEPVPFLAEAVAHGDHATFKNTSKIVQVTGCQPKGEYNLVFLSDREYLARVAFGHDTDSSQFEKGVLIALKDFEVSKRKNAILMTLLNWDVVGKTPKLYGDPQSKLSDAKAAAPQPTANAVAEQKPKQTTKSRAGYAPDGAIIVTVEAISPYISTNWQAEVRATRKSNIREFTRNDRTGKVFNVTFTDDTGEIQATGFGDDAVRNFYDEIVEGQTYAIGKLEARLANKNFNKTGHQYELYFTPQSKVEFIRATDLKLPEVFFKFVPNLEALQQAEVDSTVDVIGVAQQVGQLQQLTSRANVPYTKRDITLSDDSGCSIVLTLWGSDAESFDPPVGTVIAAKSVRLSSFAGRSLSATRSAKVYADPDEPRAHQLKGWYEAAGSAQTFKPVAEDPLANGGSSREDRRRVTISDVIAQRLGYNESEDYFTVRARISQVFQRAIAYPSCTNGECRKKVVEDGDRWYCEKCGVSMDAPRYRFILTMSIDDVSSEHVSLSVSVFDEIGKQLYGDKAEEFQNLKDPSGSFSRDLDTQLSAVKGNDYMWDIRGTLDTYNGEARARYTAVHLRKVDDKKEARRALAEMRALPQEDA